jgi:hypothetical protein
MALRGYARNYFSRPPLKSLYFWLHTIWLAVVLIMALVFGRLYYARLSTGGMWWIGLAAVATVILWWQARRSHSKLHELYAASVQQRGSESECQTQLDSALEQAAYIQDTGLYVASFVLMAVLLGLSEILRR